VITGELNPQSSSVLPSVFLTPKVFCKVSKVFVFWSLFQDSTQADSAQASPQILEWGNPDIRFSECISIILCVLNKHTNIGLRCASWLHRHGVHTAQPNALRRLLQQLHQSFGGPAYTLSSAVVSNGYTPKRVILA